MGEFIICTLSILLTGALGIMEFDGRYSLEIIKRQNLKVIFHCKKVSRNNASKEEKHQKLCDTSSSLPSRNDCLALTIKNYKKDIIINVTQFRLNVCVIALLIYYSKNIFIIVKT